MRSKILGIKTVFEKNSKRQTVTPLMNPGDTRIDDVKCRRIGHSPRLRLTESVN